MRINNILKQKNTRMQKFEIVEPSIKSIIKIKDKVRPLIEKYHNTPSIYNSFPEIGLKLEQDIITDAVTLIELKLNKNSKTIVNHHMNEKFMKQLTINLSKKRINFDNVIKEGAKLLNIKNVADYSEYIHSNPRFRDNHILRTELDLFINRGNFKWTTFDRSDFIKYILDSKQNKLKSDAKINCWEAMLYSLIRGGALNKRDVAELYSPMLKMHQVLEKLSEAFRWETSKHITDKVKFEKFSSYVPYFIEISTKGCKYLGGLHHDMISFPNSTDKVIQTLVNDKYQGDIDRKTTVYSHWNKWTDSRVGVAPNEEINKLVEDMETHIIPLHIFMEKFPEVSKKVVAGLLNNNYN